MFIFISSLNRLIAYMIFFILCMIQINMKYKIKVAKKKIQNQTELLLMYNEKLEEIDYINNQQQDLNLIREFIKINSMSFITKNDTMDLDVNN